MKELIPKDDYGIFVDTLGTVLVDSLSVAQKFDKEHGVVLKSVDDILAPDSSFKKNFTLYLLRTLDLARSLVGEILRRPFIRILGIENSVVMQ